MNYERFLNVMDELRRTSEQAVDVRTLFSPAKTLGGRNAEQTRLAMDSALESGGYYDLLTDYIRAFNVDGGRNLAFPGYAALSMLEQNPIIRIIVETLSREATRKWVELKGGDKKDDERIKSLTEALEKYNVRDIFRDCAETAGFQGGAMLYIDTGILSDEELKTPLILKKQTVGKGKFRGFRKIEPMTVYPAEYNASDPLEADYFDPTHYYVFGRMVHRSRFLKFTSNTVNVMLRPAYNFFGIPLSQLVLRYIQNFERSRDNAAKIVDNFSLLGLKTNMTQMMQGETRDDIIKRLRMMQESGLNFGIALVDKEDEEFFQITMPVSGLEAVVAQQLELVALISSIPVTKLFGTPPKGFNATGESDIQNFYDRVKNWQERLFYKNFETARKIIELSEFGETYDDIVSEWLPLKDPTPAETAQIELMKAQRDMQLVQAGAIDAEDIRNRLSQDTLGDYANIDPEDLPDAPEEEPDEFGEETEAESDRSEAEDAEVWRTTKSKEEGKGRHYKIDTETGEITAGFGGKLHGVKIGNKSKIKVNLSKMEGFHEYRYQFFKRLDAEKAGKPYNAPTLAASMEIFKKSLFSSVPPEKRISAYKEIRKNLIREWRESRNIPESDNSVKSEDIKDVNGREHEEKGTPEGGRYMETEGGGGETTEPAPPQTPTPTQTPTPEQTQTKEESGEESGKSTGENAKNKEGEEESTQLPQDITEFLGEKFEGVKGQEAINKLMNEKKGHVKAAFTRQDIGDIDLVWGDETAGLAHIIKRRTEQGIDINSFLSDLDEVVEKGKISKGRNNAFEVLGNGKMAIISPEIKGNKLTFVLTAFKTRKKA